MEGKENFKPRKRFRNPNKHQRYLNKVQREKGLEYVTKNGKNIPAKKFTKVICKCRKLCHLTTDETLQKQAYDEYWSLGSWNQKTSFLLNHIIVADCKIQRKPTLRKNIVFKKSFNREYYLANKEIKVCKYFFKKVLQVTEGRIEQCMKKKTKEPQLMCY